MKVHNTVRCGYKFKNENENFQNFFRKCISKYKENTKKGKKYKLGDMEFFPISGTEYSGNIKCRTTHMHYLIQELVFEVSFTMELEVLECSNDELYDLIKTNTRYIAKEHIKLINQIIKVFLQESPFGGPFKKEEYKDNVYYLLESSILKTPLYRSSEFWFLNEIFYEFNEAFQKKLNNSTQPTAKRIVKNVRIIIKRKEKTAEEIKMPAVQLLLPISDTRTLKVVNGCEEYEVILRFSKEDFYQKNFKEILKVKSIKDFLNSSLLEVVKPKISYTYRHCVSVEE